MTRPLFALLLLLPCSAAGASIEVHAVDGAKAPLADLVVYAMPRGAPAAPRRAEGRIEQRDKAFVPLVSVVQTGTAVQFPNLDPIRHHVYSFSPAKRFELKLYVGTPVDPVVFDKPGEVVLGCNIHDHMIAYVYVVDTPWFARTDAQGRARIEGLPAGEYDLQAVHYSQARAVPARRVTVAPDQAALAEYAVATRPRPAPAPPR